MENKFIQKSRNIRLDDCIEEFKHFLNIEYGETTPLNKQLELFSKFSFNNLFNETYISQKANNDDKLKSFYHKLQEDGKGDGKKYHEDSTRLARIVYYIIHNNEYKTEYSLPQLQNFYDISYNNYSGETLNNFELTTIGNFMLLPKKTYERKSLNTVKGMVCYGYKDYFDLFWIDVFKVLNGISCDNFDLIKKIIDKNEFYFGTDYFTKKFIKSNFLEDYFDLNNQPKNLYNHDKEDYKIAQNLVNSRSRKIINVLNEVIEKYKESFIV